MKPSTHTRWIFRSAAGVVVACLFSGTVQAQLVESFEAVEIGEMPPAGWLKWQEAGGRGWSNSWAGRQPMPGWMSGTNSVPPDPDAGSRMAYVTYTHGGAKTNDLWLISPTLHGLTATSTVSFWQNNAFTNFADNLRLWISTNPNAYRKSDFTTEAWALYMPRASVPGYVPPGTGNFGDWTQVTVNIGSMAPAGTDIRLGFQEYHNNNWYDVRAIELDVIRSDLWAAPSLTTTAVRASGDVIELDVNIFAGYPCGEMGICWGHGPGPEAMDSSGEWFDSFAEISSQGASTCVLSNMDSGSKWWIRPYVKHSKAGTVYGNEVVVYPGDSAGEGYLFESFETTPIGQMPPPGWSKWQEAGGRGWSNSYAGRQPIPGWMSGTNSVPPAEGAGSKMAYVTYTHGGAKTNDLWLISPTIENVPENCELTFWHRNSFTNFADNLRVYVSEEPEADRKADFVNNGKEVWSLYMPRGVVPGYVPPGTGDFGGWTQVTVNMTNSPGSDIRLGFQEYHNNNWYDVRAIELDLIRMGSTDVRNGLWFDGIDDQVILPLENSTPSYTIEAWVCPERIGAMNIVVGSDSDPLTEFSRQLRMTAGGVFEHYNRDGSERRVTGTTTAQAGRWYHIVGVSQNNGTMRLYVNGVEEGMPVGVGTVSTCKTNCLGSASGHGMTNFQGRIDEVRFWNTVRTPSEVVDCMNIYLRGVETGLVACYRMDRTSGGDVFDSSFNGYDGRFCADADSYAWKKAAPLYDGVDDKTFIPVETTPASYTIEAWVYPADRSARNIMVYTDGNPLTSYNRQLRINSAGRFEFYTYDGSVRLVTGTTVLQSNTWYHVAGTAQNGGTMRLFVNGIQENSGPSGNTLWSTGDQYQIGAATGGGFTWFKGRITGASETNRVKSTAEILADYQIHTEGPPTNTRPQWAASASPLGNFVAAQQWHPRGVWSSHSTSTASRGLSATAGGGGNTNYFVFGDNNLTGIANSTLSSGGTVGRQNRIWHFDLHGSTQQVATLSFDPVAAGATVVMDDPDDYLLLRRDGTSGDFTAIRSSADTVSGGVVTFNTVELSEGYYTLGTAPPVAPDIQPATHITAYSFFANWGSVDLVTGYQLDVSGNSSFSSFIDGYSNMPVSSAVTTMSVTGLLPGVTYYYRVRSERDGAVGTNSATASPQTLTEGAIGLNPAMLNFNSAYGSDPSAQTFAATNLGQTAYAFTSSVTYSPEASGWLTMTDGLVPADGSLVCTATVSSVSLNVGTYSATNLIQSLTATNSPQQQVIILTVSQADQTIIFPAIGNRVTTDHVGLAATATSGLNVSFNVDSGPAVLEGGTNLSFNGAGVVSVVATQPGDSNWNAASVTNIFTVSKAEASVGLNNLAQVYDGTARTVTAITVPSGLTVHLTYDGSSVAPTNAGSYAVSAVVADVMYQGGASGTLVVSKSDQTISFPAISDQLSTNRVTLSATASSLLPVSFTNLPGGILTWLDANTVTFTGYGTASVIAEQAGDENYNMAPAQTNFWTVHGVPVVGPVSLTRETNGTFKALGSVLLENSTDPENSELTLFSVSGTSSQGYPVRLEGRWLIYSPPDDFTGEDSFTFTVQNAFYGDGQSTATLLFSVGTQNGDQTLNIVSVVSSGEDILVHFAGIPGRTYNVQATENLSSPAWTNLGTTTIGPKGFVIFIDSNAPPSRYYRTTQP